MGDTTLIEDLIDAMYLDRQRAFQAQEQSDHEPAPLSSGRHAELARGHVTGAIWRAPVDDALLSDRGPGRPIFGELALTLMSDRS